jgi:hypothetical protein
LRPGGGFMATVAPYEWLAQTVWIFMQVFERNPFGADVAMAEAVAVMAANADDTLVLNLNFQATAGFAQGANSVVCGGE